MKYLYLVVGAVLGCFGGGLVWKAMQKINFDLGNSILYWVIFLVLYLVLLPVLCLLGATLFGFLGYRLGKLLHEKDSDRRMSLSDEERRAFEKELKQAEAEGKEVWTRK